jgi:catechol 2,3-dioxygenase-like lactoylglutathione lyase family enzyme
LKEEKMRLSGYLIRCAGMVALSLSPLAIAAQKPTSPPIHGLAHIAIRVNDIAASRAFYEKLGYEQAFAFDKNGVVTQSFMKVNDRQFIELYPKLATSETAPPTGFLHLCFDGDDLQALHDFDVAQGLTPISIRKAGAGNLLFTLKGPEAQNIEYTQYMPGSLHFEDRGKHLGIHRIADNFFAVGLGMQNVPAASSYYVAKLGFATASRSKTLLLIPGSKDPGTGGVIATQQILIEPLAGVASRIFLYVPNLKKAATDLKKQGLSGAPGRHRLTVTDPDGNTLVLTTDTVAS